MKFVFIAKHRNIWPVAWLCNAMGVSRSGFHAWLNRSPSARFRSDETVGQQVKASFLASDRTYGARRVWRDLLADGVKAGLHRIERLMRLQALRARPRRRRLPSDKGDRQIANVPANLLDRQFVAERPNQKWIADFTYIWTAEGCGAQRTSSAAARAFWHPRAASNVDLHQRRVSRCAHSLHTFDNTGVFFSRLFQLGR
jgi:putative transposase